MKQPKRLPTHSLLIDFDGLMKEVSKTLDAFMENIWLLERALEACKSMAPYRNKVSQMRKCVSFAILLSVGIDRNNYC